MVSCTTPFEAIVLISELCFMMTCLLMISGTCDIIIYVVHDLRISPAKRTAYRKQGVLPHIFEVQI